MGKKKYIETPKLLMDYFYQYCDFVHKTPLFENVFHQRSGEVMQVPRQRPLTWIGFENWLYNQKIICDLSKYEQNDREAYTNYLPTIARIKDMIYQNKFDGAAVNLFNPSFIGKDIGLIEKTDVKTEIDVKGFKILGDGEWQKNDSK